MNYTYEDFVFHIRFILLQIAEAKKEYSYVVGIKRGGLVPAVALSHALHIPMYTLEWSNRDYPANNDSQRVLQPGSKILLVDDICDTGKTISQIKDIYSFCDILVNCSYKEGLPMTILEAMAAQVSVIATPVGAVGDLIEDKKNKYRGLFKRKGFNDLEETYVTNYGNPLYSVMKEYFMLVVERDENKVSLKYFFAFLLFHVSVISEVCV